MSCSGEMRCGGLGASRWSQLAMRVRGRLSLVGKTAQPGGWRLKSDRGGETHKSVAPLLPRARRVGAALGLRKACLISFRKNTTRQTRSGFEVSPRIGTVFVMLSPQSESINVLKRGTPCR